MVSGNVLLSEEGTTQGDPLAMPFYALATILLIRKLSEKNSARKVRFADDSAAVVILLMFKNGGTLLFIVAQHTSTFKQKENLACCQAVYGVCGKGFVQWH